MSKVLSSLLLAVLLGATAQADSIDVEIGVGVWNQEPDGNLKYASAPSFTANDVGYSDENQKYAWLDFKHPIPVLPNIRLEYTPIDFSGISTTGFEYQGVNFTSGAVSTLTMYQYDGILYWNALDNTANTTIDLGLDFKYIDTRFKASQSGTSIKTADEVTFPMLYGRLRFKVPETDIGLEGDIKYMGYKSSKIFEYRLKADYLIDIATVKLGIEAGYRFQKINVNNDDFKSLDTTGDIDVSGFYAGIMARF